MKYLIAVLFITLYSSAIFSQENEKVEELYYEGNEYLLSEEHIEALPTFLELNKIAPSANIKYKLGECCLNIDGEKAKAIPFLESAVLSSSRTYDAASPYEKNTPFRAWYLLGKAYRINNEPDKAIEALNTLLDSLNGDDPEIVEEIQWEIEVNEMAKIIMESPISLKKENVGESINNNFSNYNAVVTADENTIFYMDALKFYDAVMVSTKEGGEAINDNLTPKLRSDGDYYLAHVSPAGDRLLFYYYDIFTKGDIYESVKKDDKWGKLKKLNENINSNYHESHASISGDGKTLYFTSNRPGGFGALDIYQSELDENGEWGTAINLGGVINSYKNENTPFITEDGKTLFFSSENHYNMGGYDIFKATRNGYTWSKPKNLGYPINTTDDDLFFFPIGDGKTAYMAIYDDSKGLGKDDIFRLTNITDPELRKFTLTGKLDTDIDDSQIQALIESNGEIIAEPEIKEGQFQHRVKEGEYDIRVKAEGYEESVTEVTLDDDQDVLKIPLEFVLNKIEETITAMEQDSIVLKNIYFLFDKYRLSEKNQKYLSELVEELKEYDLTWVVKGYTDSKGPDVYNLYLSELRAKAVKAYLEKIGIRSENLQVKAYGEKDPIARDQTESGADLPAGRKYNRRVEISFENLPEGVVFIKQTEIPEHLLK